MSEQYKAKELVDKMYENQLLSLKLEKKALAYELAKQCALIAVDEIMNLTTFKSSAIECLRHIKYWQKVKQHIENL